MRELIKDFLALPYMYSTTKIWLWLDWTKVISSEARSFCTPLCSLISELINGKSSDSITNYMRSHEMSATEVVSDLRAAVEHAAGLTISAGIAPNKMLAKVSGDANLAVWLPAEIRFDHTHTQICSDINKPSECCES